MMHCYNVYLESVYTLLFAEKIVIPAKAGI